MQRRLLAGYVILGLAIVAVAAVSIYFGVIRSSSSSAWSSWKPQGSDPQSIEDQIASHVESRYRQANGKPLAKVSFGPLAVDQRAIESIGYMATAKAKPQLLATGLTSGSVEYDFSPPAGQSAVADKAPTTVASTILRQAGLELALYTLKYVPSVQTVVVFMPPRPFDPGPMLSLYTRDQAQDVLKVPFERTIPGPAPLPGKVTAVERQRIDARTTVFRWQPSQDPNQKPALLLFPAPTS